MRNKFSLNAALTKARRKRKPKAPPKTAEQYSVRGERFQETWNRVAHVIAKMRSEKVSLTQAARDVGISPRAVTRWGKTALRKNKAGRYQAKRTDRLLRVLQTPTATGPREIAVKSSVEASILGEHSAALSKYVATGNAADLSRFADVYVTDVSGARVRLLTDLTEIDNLAGAGVLSFESLYARS